MSIHPTAVLSLLCSLTPRVSCSLTPRVSCSLTPRVSCSLTPRVSCSLTPRVSCSLTPRVSCSLTPRVSCSLTPRVSCSLTPRVSCSLTPRVSYSLTPRVSCSLTPRVSCSLTPRVSCSLTPRLSTTSAPTLSFSTYCNTASCLTPLLCFHHILLGQSSLFFFANSIVVFSFLAVERHYPDKMRASFLLLFCVVLLAAVAYANEDVSTCRITVSFFLAKLLYRETVQLRSINTIQRNTL